LILYKIILLDVVLSLADFLDAFLGKAFWPAALFAVLFMQAFIHSFYSWSLFNSLSDTI
jgi:hypothetical protein